MVSHDETSAKPEGTMNEAALKAAQVAAVSYDDLVDSVKANDVTQFLQQTSLMSKADDEQWRA